MRFLPILGLVLIVTIFLITQPKPSKITPVTKPSPTISQQKTPVEYLAEFTVSTNGLKRDFSDKKYHNLSTDIFIEAENPQIIHVKKADLTWGDFFKTLPMKLTRECLTTGTGQVFCDGEGGNLQFFINGELTNDFLSKEIKENDKALITFGPN